MFGVEKNLNVNRGGTGTAVSFPAPIGGWNAKDALADMPLTDAVTMVNWWPTTSYIQVRSGFVKFATGFPAVVETVAAYQGSGTRLFGCSGGNVYDASAQGVVGTPALTNLNSNRWEFVNFTTTGGIRYLCMFNGTDAPIYFDGANWTAISDITTPAITGLSFPASQFNNVVSHKNRLLLVRRDTLELYYLPVGSVGGVANLFDLRPVFRRGGVIADIETWSVDTGSGLDDRLVIATDQGEIAVYQGTDIASAATWSLVGVYTVGAMVGRRCLAKYGGDVLAICSFGLLPLSSLLLSKVINVANALTDKIQNAISAAIDLNAGNFGWQAMNYPGANMLILNNATGNDAWEQYCMNTITGAWTRFTGMNAACWETYFQDAYFGSDTFIGHAWNGLSDAGNNIQTELLTAFNYMGQRARLKQWTMARPIMYTDGAPAVAYGLNVDFDNSDVTDSPSFTSSTSAVWDASTWS